MFEGICTNQQLQATVEPLNKGNLATVEPLNKGHLGWEELQASSPTIDKGGN